MGATLAVNAVLIALLALWHRPGRRVERPPLLAVPIHVTDLPPEEMTLAADSPPAGPAAAAPPPTLPVPPLPGLPAATLNLELPSHPGLDAIGISTVAAEVPAFLAEPVLVAAAVGSAAAGIDTPRPAPSAGPSHGPVLVQPLNLSDYYPPRARISGLSGATTVRLAITAAGQVGDVTVLSSTPAGVFEDAAIRLARTLRFRPALRDGRPVPATVSLNLIWRLEQ